MKNLECNVDKIDTRKQRNHILSNNLEFYISTELIY